MYVARSVLRTSAGLVLLGTALAALQRTMSLATPHLTNGMPHTQWNFLHYVWLVGQAS